MSLSVPGVRRGLETLSVGGKRRPVGDFSINYYREHQSGGRRMVIISDRRGLTGPGRWRGRWPASPGDRRSPLTRRDRARSSRAQSTHPTRSFAFRCSADNSGLPELVFHVGRPGGWTRRPADNAHGPASASQKPRLGLARLRCGYRINGRPYCSSALPVEPSLPLLLGDGGGQWTRED